MPGSSLIDLYVCQNCLSQYDSERSAHAADPENNPEPSVVYEFNRQDIETHLEATVGFDGREYSHAAVLVFVKTLDS